MGNTFSTSPSSLVFSAPSYDKEHAQLRIWLRSPDNLDDLNPADQSHLARWSSAVSRDLHRCEDTLVRLRILTENASAELRRVTDLRDHYHGLSAAIRRLPSHVLQHIFFLCTLASSMPWNTALTTSSICSRWRSIALASPWLWCIIPVYTERSCTLEHHHFELVEAFLGRSQSLPHAMRWKWLDIRGRTWSLADTYWAEISNFPILCSVHIEDAILAELLIVRNCPMLQKLTLVGKCEIDSLPSNLHHVEDVAFHWFMMPSLIPTILQSMPDSFSKATIADCVDMDNTSDFTQRLITPNLTYLNLGDMTQECLDVSLPGFLSRVCPPLRALLIQLVVLPGVRHDFNPEILRYDPDLENLGLCYITAPSESSQPGMVIGRLLRDLTVPNPHNKQSDSDDIQSEAGVLLPRLQEFQLCLTNTFGDRQALTDMIASRRAQDDECGVLRLRRLCLTMPVGPMSMIIPPGADDRGLRAHIVGQEPYRQLLELGDRGLQLIFT